MSTLRIYFSAQWRDSTADCPWALCSDAGALLQSGHGPLAAMPRADECIAVLAADRALRAEIDVPGGPRRRWLRALPLLAEEHTLSDPEENHVVPLPSPDGKKQALLISDKSWLRRIVEACRAAALPLRKAVPESALPAVAPGGWTLVWNGRNGFVCTSQGNGMALDSGDAQSPPLALQLLEPGIPAPNSIELRFPHDLPPEQRILPQWQGLAPAPGSDWDWRSAPIPASAPNLLWGELAPPARPLEWWPKLRPAALLLLAVLGVEMAGTNLLWAMQAYEKRSLARNMEQSFHQAFGNAAAVVNAPLQMRRNLADMRHGAGMPDDGDFLSLLNGVSKLLAELPAGSVREMHYESGRLDIEIRLGALAEASALQNKLRDSGIGVRTDIQDTGNGINLRITLQQGAAA